MNQYDVVIRMGEPRYWVLLSLSFVAGWALFGGSKPWIWNEGPGPSGKSVGR